MEKHIDSKGIYKDCKTLEIDKPSKKPKILSIFLSKPGTLNTQQQTLVQALTAILAKEDVTVDTVEREDYPGFGAVSEVRRVMNGCAGVVVLAFRQLEVHYGTWRNGTEEARNIENTALPSAWNHVEAGMAAMAGLPVLFVVEQGVEGGPFELEDIDHIVAHLDLNRPDYQRLGDMVRTWCNSVRE